MLILHASLAGADNPAFTRLLIWGESRDQFRRADHKGRRGHGRSVPDHPYAASIQSLTKFLLDLGVDDWEVKTVPARLPSLGSIPKPSRPYLLDSEPEGDLGFKEWKVPAASLKPVDALGLLAVERAEDDSAPGIEFGPDLEFWKKAGRFVLELLAGQRFLPELADTGNGIVATWRPALQPDDRYRFDRLAASMPGSARAVSLEPNAPELGPHTLLATFVNSSVDAFARRAARFGPRRKNSTAAPGEAWLAALVSENPSADIPRSFFDDYSKWRRPADPNAGGNFRMCFRLDPPAPERAQTSTAGEDGARTADEIVAPEGDVKDWILKYFLQAEDDPSLLVPAEAVWRARGSALRFLNRKFDAPQERMLAGLGLAERMFSPIRDSLKQATPTGCDLSTADAYSFMREAALLLQSSGFGVLLPGLGTKLGIRLKLAPKRKTEGPKGPAAGGLSFEQMVDFNWEIALGDQTLSHDEFDKLAALKVPLVRVRGEWVELRPEEIEQAVEFWRKRESKGELPLEEAMRLALDPGGASGLPVSKVEAKGWVGELIGQASGASRIKPMSRPPHFTGELRPYQAQGLSWLAFLRKFHLGACLADDMGLGKTIQAIALLLYLKSRGETKPTLLICPTSVVGNWEREVHRFAPSLTTMVHHGASRKKDTFARKAAEHDLVVSSYSLLHRDIKHLEEVEWGEVILDEAQNIKNPATQQAQAARRLKAIHRIALTGTPLENRLSELWSIFQFLNPGYLGSEESFRTQFERPIVRGQDQDAARRLKSLVGPFILRRVKTDPSVITDLPAKNEIKVFCNLTREQATLYEAVVRDSLKIIGKTEGIQRRGLVLATLMKLKQVCNHPAQFLSDGSTLDSRSGKLSRLVEMLEEVRSVTERALIFTQFAKMGDLLKRHLEAQFGDEVPFL
ncbi:MAG TPA: DEAD/DEAH box helicase, partial [Blastocatellia bacterium]|nr:DEAD/DEAH box helicase [Blastocatellia bacterium]